MKRRPEQAAGLPLITEHEKPPSAIDSDRGRYSCSRGKSRKKEYLYYTTARRKGKGENGI